METCQALVGRNWRKMLSVFRELLSRCNGEAVILQLLKVRVQGRVVGLCSAGGGG